MELKVNDYKPNEVLRFIRENSGTTQKAFAESIGKSSDWQYSNECGRTNYYFKDLIDIVKKYNLEIIIRDKE